MVETKRLEEIYANKGLLGDVKGLIKKIGTINDLNGREESLKQELDSLEKKAVMR